MTDNQVPFYRSYLLHNKNVFLDKLSELSDTELHMLNIETKAALQDARHEFDVLENKNSPEAGPIFRRMKLAGYFQAAIKLEMEAQ
jgi:phosphoglycolate phosphatase-like HAD superfamily hydrolase